MKFRFPLKVRKESFVQDVAVQLTTELKNTNQMIRKGDKELKHHWQNRFSELSAESRTALKLALLDLRLFAAQNAKYCWSKHKAPMALYWKVISVYSGHLARSL